MPHFPKPFWRPKKNRWYVQIDGKQVNLGSAKDEAFKHYHALMADRKQRPARPLGTTVVSILDAYLDWCQKHRKHQTFLSYTARIQSFTDSLKDKTLAVEAFKPFHVQEWVDSHPSWNPGMKRGRIMAVQTAFNWAVRQGRIEKSPIASMEKPPQGKREQVVSLPEYQAVLGAIGQRQFRDLVEAAWETGARPQELTIVEARHFNPQQGTWVFPPHEAKGKRWRVVYLNDTAIGIVRRLMLKWPEGPLFRNRDGNPWTPFAVNCAFRRVRIILGRARMKELGITGSEHADKQQRRKENDQLALKYGKKYCLYNFRHSWATTALKSLDPVTVSVLMGHADTSMLAKIYQHLAQDQKHLQDAVRKIKPASA